jgi:hypothetical protein
MMRQQQQKAHKSFLLGEKAIQITPEVRTQNLSLAQSANFIFGADAVANTWSDSLGQTLGMLKALAGEQLGALWDWIGASNSQQGSNRKNSAFHSFYPSATAQEPLLRPDISTAQAAFRMSIRQTIKSQLV